MDWWMWANCPLQEDVMILRRSIESLKKKRGNGNRKQEIGLRLLFIREYRQDFIIFVWGKGERGDEDNSQISD